MLLTEMPSYMNSVLGVDIKSVNETIMDEQKDVSEKSLIKNNYCRMDYYQLFLTW